MSTPRQAVATERGRYYIDPANGRQYPSVTNVLDTAIHKPALVPWAAKVTAEYAVANLPMLLRTARIDRKQAIKDLKSQVRFVKDTAADLGTRVHDAAEARALGAPLVDDPEVAPYVRQHAEWLSAWGIDLRRDVVAAECSMVNRTHGYAGTADLFAWLPLRPDGRPGGRSLWLVDYKTSEKRSAMSIYTEHVLQLAALRNCEHIWLPNDTEEPVPQVAGCAVLNLRQRTHKLIPVLADDAAFQAFLSALAVTRYLHGFDFEPVAAEAPLPGPGDGISGEDLTYEHLEHTAVEGAA